MPRKKKTILEEEIDALPLGEMVLEALEVPGMSYRCARIACDSQDCIVIIATGPAASVWLEIAENYRLAMSQGESTNGEPVQP